MSKVQFTPTFSHKPWVDNRDRVSAAGSNGFNIRFAAIQEDLGKLSDVVREIDNTLKSLSVGPGVQEYLVTLSPILTATTGGGAWTFDNLGNAVRPPVATSLSGIAQVVLPHGATLLRLRATGVNSGSGSLRVSLMRARLVGTSSSERLARVTGDANPFDHTADVDPQLAKVDNATFRYFILAALDNAGTADSVSLSGFQINYLA